MIFTTDELRRLWNFYRERTMEELFKWGDEAVSIGRPAGHGPWVDSDGRIRPAEDTFTVFDQNQAVLILRREPRKVKVQQVVYTPMTDKERQLRQGEYYNASGDMYESAGRTGSIRIPYKRTVVEVEIEVEEESNA